MADFDEIYEEEEEEEEEDEERAVEEQLLKYSPDPVVVRGSGHVTVNSPHSSEELKVGHPLIPQPNQFSLLHPRNSRVDVSELPTSEGQTIPVGDHQSSWGACPVGFAVSR